MKRNINKFTNHLKKNFIKIKINFGTTLPPYLPTWYCDKKHKMKETCTTIMHEKKINNGY